MKLRFGKREKKREEETNKGRPMRDPYEVLGLAILPSSADIKNGVSPLAKKFHPDARKKKKKGGKKGEGGEKKRKEVSGDAKRGPRSTVARSARTASSLPGFDGFLRPRREKRGGRGPFGGRAGGPGTSSTSFSSDDILSEILGGWEGREKKKKNYAQAALAAHNLPFDGRGDPRGLSCREKRGEGKGKEKRERNAGTPGARFRPSDPSQWTHSTLYWDRPAGDALVTFELGGKKREKGREGRGRPEPRSAGIAR